MTTVEVAPSPARTKLDGAVRAARPALPGAGALYGALAAAAIALAALSLLLPSTPSYDPWAWLIWGREIVHASLQTVAGPSWKPLPVLFTTLFGAFGRAAPDLWLVVARAGALMAAAMAFVVAFKLTRRLTRMPSAFALLAGAFATASLINSRGFISDNALGYSEGLAIALVLIAVERHLEGAGRQAFVAGFFAALDRPEVWLVWAPYGAYLFWKDVGARRLVPALFALTPALWLLPELWGSGQLLRGVTRAQHPRSNSPAFAHCPFCTEFGHHAWRTVWTRVKLAALVGGAAAALALLGVGSVRSRSRSRALLVLLTLVVSGFGWWITIALETQAGFSGNDRYLALGAALVSVAGAVVWGWGAYGLAVIARRFTSGPVADAATALLALAVFVAFPPWLGKSLVNLGSTRRALAYQADLRQDVGQVVAHVSHPGAILRCGTVMTEGFQVPMVAWELGVPIDRVEATPASTDHPGPAPNVIFQTRATRSSFLLPIVGAWTGVHYRLVAHVRTFRMYSACRGRVTL